VSGKTRAEREAKEWLRLTAWVNQEKTMPPSALYNGPRHVEGLLAVIKRLRGTR